MAVIHPPFYLMNQEPPEWQQLTGKDRDEFLEENRERLLQAQD